MVRQCIQGEVHKNPRFFYQRQVARFIEEITCYTEGLQTGFTNLPAIHSDAHGLPVTGCNISHLWKTPVFRTYQRCKRRPKNLRQVQKFTQFTKECSVFLALQNDVMLTHFVGDSPAMSEL